jgi:hypothetical protein
VGGASAVGGTSTTDDCEISLSLSEQATNPINKSNAAKVLRTRLPFSVIYLPAPLEALAANIAGALDLFNVLCVSGPTHKSYNGNVIALSALPLTRHLTAWHYRRSVSWHKSQNGQSNGAHI